MAAALRSALVRREGGAASCLHPPPPTRRQPSRRQLHTSPLLLAADPWSPASLLLQLALALALLGCLLQPEGPRRLPPRWQVAAAAEAPADLNLTALRWGLAAAVGRRRTTAVRQSPLLRFCTCRCGPPRCTVAAPGVLCAQAGARRRRRCPTRPPHHATPAGRSRAACSALATASTWSVHSRGTTCGPSRAAARTPRAASRSP